MALASLERKRQQALVQAGYEEELKAGKLPEAFAGRAIGLLTKPDKNSIEYKALEAAAAARGISQARLMLECRGDSVGAGAARGALPVRILPARRRFCGGGDRAAARRPARSGGAKRSPSTTSRPPRSTTRSPSSISPTAACASAFTSQRRRSASRAATWSTRSRTPAVHRLHARRQDHDAAGQRRRCVHARRGRPAPDVVALHHREPRDAGDRRARDARRARVREEQPAPQPSRRIRRRRKRLANGSGEYPHKEDIAVLWPLAQALFEKRQERARSTA